MPDQKLLAAVDDAVVRLGDWLLDNTDLVFEEQPEIDEIRSNLAHAADEARK